MKGSNALLLTVALGSFALLQPTSSWAQASADTQNIIFPVDFYAYVPCAAGGVGEVVEFTGEFHDLFHVTANATGFHVEISENSQGISGTGVVTGDKYQATGGVHGQRNDLRVGGQLTLIRTFSMVGQGNGNNLLEHDNEHVTVNANGEITVFHDNYSIECK